MPTAQTSPYVFRAAGGRSIIKAVLKSGGVLRFTSTPGHNWNLLYRSPKRPPASVGDSEFGSAPAFIKDEPLDINAEPHPPPCTKCGSVMVLVRIKQASPGFDLRTFECLECHNADQYVIQYGTTAPW